MTTPSPRQLTLHPDLGEAGEMDEAEERAEGKRRSNKK